MDFNKQFKEYTDNNDYKSAAQLLYEYGGYFVITKEMLKQYICSKIIEEDYKLAKHLLDSIYNDSDADYWVYDFSFGVLDTPKPITDTNTVIEIYDGTI